MPCDSWRERGSRSNRKVEERCLHTAQCSAELLFEEVFPARNPLTAWFTIRVYCKGPMSISSSMMIRFNPMRNGLFPSPIVVTTRSLNIPRTRRLIWKHQRPRLITCMAEASVAARRSLQPLTAAQLWCQDHHHDFAVVTEASLHSQSALLSNLELLAVHAFARIPPQTYEYLLNTIISIGGPFSPLELVQRSPLLHPSQTKSSVWNLVYHGELLTDLTQPLHFATTPLLWRGRRSSGPSSRGLTSFS